MFSGDRVRRRMPSEDALNLEESSSFIVEDDDDKYAPKPHGTGLPPLDHGRIRASSEMPQNLYGEHTYPQQHHMYTNTGMGNSMDMGTLGNMSSRESMSHNSSMYNSNPGPYAPAPGTPFDMAYSHLTDAKDAIPDYRAKTHKLALVFMSLMALLTRLFRLGAPPNVVWDEVHFGKFASYYLRRSFFFDVHPPLGKMLYALVGYMAGYDGSYDFAKISTPYKGIEPPVPYFALRLAPALCGTLQVPITYLTVIELGGSNVAAVVASALLLFDNGHITQSRFILLDGWLITFILMAFYFYCCFRTQNRLYPFSVKWWVYLCLSGTFLALAASVKLVGVFVIAVVGVHTALELWRVWKDTRNAIWPTFAAHLGSRVACLIVLPVCIVLCVFQAHFAVLIHSGPGDSHMSRQFQSQLIGSPHAQQVEPMPQDIAFGSIITFTPQQFKPDCWIHSHEHRWPKVYFEGTKKRRVGSAQQQVTCYPHQDHNNQWMVLEPDRYTKYHHNVMNLTMDIDGGEEPHAVTKFVRHGDNIKLYHVSTQTFLHTHDVASYGFPSKQEVSTWNGSETVAPMTDFTIQFTEAGGEAGKRWHPFRTRFRLVHVATQTTLEMSGERLPDFAFGQYEIISSKHTTTKDVFYVDTHKNDRLDASVNSGFESQSGLSSTLELISEMIRSNNRLTGKHVYQSLPGDWPVLARGISFFRDTENETQVYLIPNPFGWYSAHLFVLVSIFAWVCLSLRRARDFYDLTLAQWAVAGNVMGLSLFAYALHYFPFFLMDRQLFLHHYLPASVFMYQACGLFFGFAANRLPPVLKYLIVLLYLVGLITTFVLYAPLTYNFHSDWNLRPLKMKVAWDFAAWDAPKLQP